MSCFKKARQGWLVVRFPYAPVVKLVGNGLCVPARGVQQLEVRAANLQSVWFKEELGC